MVNKKLSLTVCFEKNDTMAAFINGYPLAENRVVNLPAIVKALNVDTIKVHSNKGESLKLPTMFRVMQNNLEEVQDDNQGLVLTVELNQDSDDAEVRLNGCLLSGIQDHVKDVPAIGYELQVLRIVISYENEVHIMEIEYVDEKEKQPLTEE